MIERSKLLAVLIPVLLAGAAEAGRDRRPPPNNSHRVHHHDHARSRSGVAISFGYSSGYSSYSRFGSGWCSPGWSSPGWTSTRWGSPRTRFVYDYAPPPRTVVVERPVLREVVREVPVYRDVPVYREVERAPASRFGAGWSALADGDLHHANAYFEDQTANRPDDSTPKIGLALARAAGGNDDTAEWAMRRAVRGGLERGASATPTDRLDRLLASLELRFEERSFASNDRWFMLASIRYLRGDLVGARRAAERALEFDRNDYDARRIYEITRSG